MVAQFGANPVAVHSVAEGVGCRAFAAIAITATLLGGCIPAVPLIGADPADPTVPVPAVRYRSGIAPYVSMRPVAPSGWKDRNERVTPTSKTER
jgi:hypothetical protein|nr:hypothetical protein [Bradyrhizobium sp.]